MTKDSDLKLLMERLTHTHFNNVEEYRGGPSVTIDKASLRDANDLFVKAVVAISRLVQELATANGLVATGIHETEHLEARAAAAESKLEEMRSALACCIDPLDAEEIGTQDWWREAHNAVVVAKRALGEQP